MVVSLLGRASACLDERVVYLALRRASVFYQQETKQGPWSVVQVLIAGGSSQWCAQYDTPASNESYLVDVTPGANHTPALENMTYRRVVSFLTIVHIRAGACWGAYTFVAYTSRNILRYSAHHHQLHVDHGLARGICRLKQVASVVYHVTCFSVRA